MPEVSVIFPVFNTSKYLPELFEEMLNQTFSDVEFIFVDDGSSDNSAEIIKEYAQKDNRIKYFYQENAGGGAARNFGISKAEGKYVICLDSDDIYEKTLVEDMYNQAKKTDADITVCSFNIFDVSSNTMLLNKGINTRCLPNKKVFCYKDVENIFEITNPGPSNKLYKKEFITKYNLKYSETRIINDLKFGMVALVLAEKITTINRSLSTYRFGVDGSCSYNRVNKIIKGINVFDEINKEFYERNLIEKVKESYIKCIFNNIKFSTSIDENLKIYLRNFFQQEPFASLSKEDKERLLEIPKIVRHYKKYSYLSKILPFFRKFKQKAESDNNCLNNIKDIFFMDLKNKILLSNEFLKIWQKIENNENFALLRYGDGERAIMTGKKVTAQEGWQSPSEIGELGKALLNTLNIENENFIYGISCPCCDREAYYWYSTRIKSKNKTFANIFVNKNYPEFIKNFEKLKRDAIFIGNYRAKGKKIGNLNILKYYEISDNCFEFWENDAQKLVQNIENDFGNKNNLLYVFSAGPLSEPLITELWKNNPNNCYIDFGSCLDKYIHEKTTRPYENPNSKYGKRNCEMDNPETTDFDVSVVLTLYKRPENLKLQLDAIKNQTLKPKEILLYQDGTGDTIKIPEEIKNEFDLIEISPENKGVWERFRIALKNAKSEYVCLFDDDTIPGESWLENCHSNMLKQEGIYGTIGILCKDAKNYPFGDYLRLGWGAPIRETTEVDFVGHSWFFKKEWLKYMFKDTEKYQAYKYAGEDMGLSFMAKKEAMIRTFVPPHPVRHQNLWGSLLNYASKLGNNSKNVAVSLNKDNQTRMNKAINDYLSCGYIPLCVERKNYVKKMWNRSTFIKTTTKFIPCKKLRHKLRSRLTEFLYQ